MWTGGYAGLLVLVALCGLRSRSSTHGTAEVASGVDAPSPSQHQRLRWVALSFVPSSYLLGVTTFISSDIAAVPLLWVVPLALYLLTFVLVFAARPPLPHALVIRLLPPAVLAAVMLMMARASQPVWLVLAVHLVAFFVAAMACHGELARLRPPPARLTDFYLMLSLGGALGGAFNAVLAPWIFNRPLEYPIAIALACYFALREPRDETERGPARARNVHRVLDIVLPLVLCTFAFIVSAMIPARTVPEALPLMIIFLAVPVLLCWTFAARPRRFALGVVALLAPATLLPPAHATLLDVRRSFFGVHRTLHTRDDRFNQLFHGTTMHGAQRVDPATGRATAPDQPTSYYHEDSPFAAIFASVVAPRQNPRVGVAGLGGGSIAGFAKPGWELKFFEIDPVVVWAAERSGHFTFIPAARQRGAAVETILGDARLTIAQQPDKSFDLLVLDAFSGDAVPVHLLTREAVAMYLTKLRDDGVLVIHISNLYLDLRPVVAAIAGDADLFAMIRDDPDPSPEERARGSQGSRLVVLARSPQPLTSLAQDARWRPLNSRPSLRPWTDDFSNLIETVRWSRPPE
jgi:spermidine synthase